jgi:hypothetical protein
MKVPHSGRSEAGKHSGAAATNSVAGCRVCLSAFDPFNYGRSV